jgi:cytochrome c1
LLAAFAWLLLAPVAQAAPQAADNKPVPVPAVHFPFEGPFGDYNLPTLRRGYQIYREICANCHGMEELSYRDLEQLGYTRQEVRTFAKQYEVTDGPNAFGTMFQRPARPTDGFVDPFPNDQAARVANNGSLPPDLAIIVKGREGGPAYVYAFLQGFRDPPPGFELANGTYYNSYFPGHMVAMPPMLSAGAVTFADGAPNDLASEAYDIASFLQWAADPTLGERHRLGRHVLLFLLVTTILLYASKRRIWGRLPPIPASQGE